MVLLQEKATERFIVFGMVVNELATVRHKANLGLCISTLFPRTGSYRKRCYICLEGPVF